MFIKNKISTNLTFIFLMDFELDEFNFNIVFEYITLKYFYYITNLLIKINYSPLGTFKILGLFKFKKYVSC